jgi:hypothetical protein
MSINDDRPDAGGDGAGDHTRSEWESRWDDLTASSAAVNPPERFLQSLTESEKGPILTLFRRLSANHCRLYFAAGQLARLAVKLGHPFGADTLPAAMRLLHGLEVPNDKTRSVMVAAVVCAWPELRGRVRLRDRVARILLQSGWRPDLPKRRRRKP